MLTKISVLKLVSHGYPPPPTSLRSTAFRATAIVFGCVLIVASILKLSSGRNTIDSPISTFFPEWSHGLFPWFELVLGTWLISGWARHLAWLISIPVLAVFTIHGLLLSLARQSSCGCFGNVSIPPIVTLLFDMAVLAIFIRCRPVWLGLNFGPQGGSVILTGLTVSIIVAIVAGYSIARFGSIGGALLVARGQSVLIDPTVLQFDQLDPNEIRQQSIVIRNHSAETVDVVLFEANCQCAVVKNLPMTIAPGQSAKVELDFLAPAVPGTFQRNAQFSTTNGKIEFTVQGTVKLPSTLRRQP
jgi:hypothetical protein